ncbi:MAG: M20 family metallopeptidase [Alphaproteobacteria bacterium]
MTADIKSITAFAQKLVQTPSQGGIDAPDAIVNAAYDFGRALGLPFKKISDAAGKPVALVCEIEGALPGKTWCLNACLDTAPAGDRSTWAHDPFSGDISNGRLHGRGAADSKVAVSIFMHVAQELQAQRDKMQGKLLLIFDADEHTGNFGGIKAALDAGYKPDGVMIGYPGNDKVVVGSRGFARYEIVLTGKGAHSGADAVVQDNALVRLSDLVGTLTVQQPVAAESADFPKPPKLTVTEMHGGDGYSVVPSKAVARVDIRLTPAFNEAAADQHIRDLVAAHDAKHDVPAERASTVSRTSSEPPYLTPATSPLRVALREAIEEITGSPVPERVSGPSNIGCFLGKQGIEATSGYGVPSHHCHAPNETADVTAIEPVFKAYKRACEKLLGL